MSISRSIPGIIATLALAHLLGATARAVNFAAAVSYTVGSGPHDVAAGDFSGDGITDLVVVNNLSNNVSILIGNGDGSFQAAVPYPATLGAPFFVAVGDFNGDAKLYLAVANKSSNNLSILTGNGDGTFGHPTNYVVGSAPSDVAIGDFNGDGFLDLAITNFSRNNLAIMLGVGNGTFQTPSYITAGTNPAGVAVADFNGDGKADLVESNQARSADNVGVFLGNGDGTFQTAATYSAEALAYWSPRISTTTAPPISRWRTSGRIWTCF